MAGYLKSMYHYVRPGSTEASTALSESNEASYNPDEEQNSRANSGSDIQQHITTHSNKKTDEELNFDPNQPQQGLLRKAASGLSNGLYSIGAGTVGLGVGTVKWVGSATYSVGSGVVSTTTGVVSSAAGAVGSAADIVKTKVKGKPKDKAD